jgi:photosystem II stability/assembly factor-like uncharacterized protein
VLLAATAAAFLPRTALANGRFPASNAVLFSPADDATVLVRVTFGLLVTRDRGRSWRWICERAIGFNGPEDPTYVVTKSGAIVAALFDGLRVSRDGGCSWQPVKTDAKVFVDLTSRADGAVVALASGYDRHADGGSLYATQLYVSTDDATTFAPIGPRLDPTLLGETVDVAPSDPSRIYVSAVRVAGGAREGALLVSADGGARWTERAIPLGPSELAPFIAAVDPERAERIYLRTSAAPDSATRLLVTDDAGKTYRRLLQARGPLLGFALSPDGATLHAGGPDDGLLTGEASAGALVPTSNVKVQCLARSGDELWACSSEASGFVAGTSRNGGAAFQAQLHLRDIGGPMQCAEGTAVAKECGADFARLASELGLRAPTGVRTEPNAAADAGARTEAGATAESSPSRGRWAWIGALALALGGGALALRARRSRR